MKTNEIAQRLVELCNNGEWEKPYEELYSPHIISMEPGDGQFKRCEGMGQLMEKGKWWNETFEVHSSVAKGPLVADDYFSVVFNMDTTHKPSGQRSRMSEVAVYKVANGKIVEEQFFWSE